MDAALVLLFTLDGIPFLYNGQEIADEIRHSIYKGIAETVQWDRAETEIGGNRFTLVQTLCQLRHTEPPLANGNVVWVDNGAPEALLSFLRETADERILVLVNPTGHPVSTSLALPSAGTYQPLLSAGAVLAGSTITLDAFGYFVGKHE